MFLSSKMKSIFSIVVTLNKMKYEFKNGVILKVSEKLVIAATNPLMCYLIIQVNYAKLLLITKLMFIGIEFEFPREASYTYDGPAKPRREIRPS